MPALPMLALLGGLIGIVVGWLTGLGVAALIPNFPPASRAAGLDPIEALRYE